MICEPDLIRAKTNGAQRKPVASVKLWEALCIAWKQHCFRRHAFYLVFILGDFFHLLMKTSPQLPV